MRGPIDYIVVAFEGNKFDGSILHELGLAIDSGAIGLLDLSLIAKDDQGEVTVLDIEDRGGGAFSEFIGKYKPGPEYVAADDVAEAGEMLENNTAAGLLVVEHLWAKPFKQAVMNAGGRLIAEGRIHPDAAAEIE